MLHIGDLTKKTRAGRLDIIVCFRIDRRSIGNDKIKTYYIDKISSPCLLSLIAAKILRY